MAGIYFHPKIPHELKPNNFDNHDDKFEDIFKILISIFTYYLECLALFTEWTKYCMVKPII